MVTKDKQGSTNKSKIYVGAGKLRIDGVSGQGGTAIVDYSSLMLYMMMPAQKAYMEMKLDDSKGEMTKSFSLFAPSDSNDPCAAWRKAVTGLTCKKVGTETLNGRSVDKWEGTRPHEEKGYLWYDSKLQFIVKIDTKEQTTEFLNIQEGPQPASLFSIPPGYRKMDMGRPSN